MPKLITMREMLAGAPTGVPGLYGIGHYEPAGIAEYQWSPYDEPGRSDRLWHHKAVGDLVDSSSGPPQPPMLPPPPAMNLPLDVPGIAQAMCAAAGKVWDDTAKQCLTKDLPPKKPPFWTPMTTALVALGIVGVGAIWAFGGGTKKKARPNVPPKKHVRSRSVRGAGTRRRQHHQRPYEVATTYVGSYAGRDQVRRFASHGQAEAYAIKRSKQLSGDQTAMVELRDAEGFTEQYDPGSW